MAGADRRDENLTRKPVDLLLNAVLLAAATAPFVVLALWRAPQRWWAPALLFLALLALDDALTSLPQHVQALHVIGGRWNWEGKVLSVVGALLVLALTSLTRREVGLTWPQRPGSLRSAVWLTLALTAIGFGLGVVFGGGRFGAETLAFQLTMPGLAEELAYRGVFMALLHRAMPGAEGARAWLPVAVTSVAFGLWHGLSVEEGRVAFDAFSALFPFLGGLAFGWLREKTGSLVFPTLAHNLSNTAGLFGGLL